MSSSSQTPKSGERAFDVVVYGATGFTGGLVAQYMAQHAPKKVRWAIAGRSSERLEAVRSAVSRLNDLYSPPIILANASDEQSLVDMALQTKVVLTTVGPFLRYGETLVKACIQAGTHYCDITGETVFVRRMIDKYHEEAKRKNVYIVPSCGCDCLFSDLGVLYVANDAQKEGRTLKNVTGFIEANAGFSGGTFHSMIGLMRDTPKRELFQMRDPYYLNPAGDDHPAASSHDNDKVGLSYDRRVNMWTYPFPLSHPNMRTVRRTNALLKNAFGPSFHYNEVSAGSSFLVGAMFVFFYYVFILLILFSPTRSLITRLGPKPGDGPSAEKRARSWLVMHVKAERDDGSKVEGRISAGDPGYTETSKMLAESAMCLAMQQDQIAKRSGIRGGVVTAGSTLGMLLVDRLQKAGIPFELIRE
mmetsp:Transcript_46341/g.116699  ORF Transcript_46341/g.116699 Transcript_46341/m.116699 type:complete len:417 (-) Transcript_46341:127-1377(-)|eukprot:CAMPEP_0177654924 /NCGR_PEP_ID=MMETSP0447-20121125/14633_1 /TAXON_ID=0 /ORGANISM="Stygamoeba regulata, Strain BSH-02190019" /LENGTH=416 /DNA_ID=CAMNT_0019158689 /DNA_START=31 /DNA_END=1281 /DNA_ORIENTATION=-